MDLGTVEGLEEINRQVPTAEPASRFFIFRATNLGELSTYEHRDERDLGATCHIAEHPARTGKRDVVGMRPQVVDASHPRGCTQM